MLLLSAIGVAILLAVAAFGMFLAHKQAWDAEPHLASDPAQLPAIDVGLVLGTQPWTLRKSGALVPNVPFAHRLDAAAALWHAGKVKYLLLSGKRDGDYDEPTAMRTGLIERGVPASALYRDFDGYRTLDSIEHARQVYGLKRLVIVSQSTHLERAMYLARSVGVDAWGLAARDEGQPWRLSSWPYLAMAAIIAWWDIHIGTLPRAAGQLPIVIGVNSPN